MLLNYTILITYYIFHKANQQKNQHFSIRDHIIYEYSNLHCTFKPRALNQRKPCLPIAFPSGLTTQVRRLILWKSFQGVLARLRQPIGPVPTLT